MEILRSVKELREFIASCNGEIGFVPTMGALHEGHLSLIKKCVSENCISIVSTFVNPTQFLPGEDFESYPKKEESDIKMCELSGVNAIFIPNGREMYFENEPKIKAPEKFANILEGKTRPGHFDGVLRVLTKLFNLVRPTRVYMGKKDAQQVLIVQNMVKTMFINTQIIPCEIVRESDGLALSSRNVYLNDEQKCHALRLSRSLMNASNLIKKGELNVSEIKACMLNTLEPLQVDYVAVVDREFNEISKIELGNAIILVAAYVGKTRLIDNLWV
ncbi:pantoate--beta-alanine ligase [Campylobacter sp. RM9344]|uniref:Pantothenate synthetase n=1 Tax=Campylobacter californiensis TaxID=1032243 RepID=A0AAW3ZVI1_9BACT|nr:MULTISPECIES: pantoate--beta-alanine ligase [unclassified Campylobacter]MBE2984003.1 pantoate--beta-alanine ligase [Campylobacter sp. RM6883]MBE2986165.1 pantoate--beta-alanine ligase [Campylobacter sp. RM12919]MBE2987577.1 pantoate--beta-alanine ligase [Campylobacter sp. RM12920]MBE2994541.1 pantoate--beta-alanine ligase [Campylobacter sp. RM6913]MBE3030074.1 pantoate--beta-alanine ligase [Campylobacter sp. RM9344]